MLEFLGLLLGLVVAGVVIGTICLVGLVLLLPFYVLFRLLGFALKVTFGGLFFVLGALILLPVAIFVGAVLLLKLLIIGIPLLLAGLLIYGFVWLLKPAPA